VTTTNLLLTGFNAFGGHAANISEALVRAIEADWPPKWVEAGSTRLTVAILPTEFAGAGDAIVDLIRAQAPDAVVCCGLAEGWGVRLELVARNRDECGAPDNAGQSRDNARIDATGPALYPGTLPYHRLGRTLTARGIPHEYSDDAGGFVCNHVFYRARREIARSGRGALCGFIHFPAAAEPGCGGRGLPLATSLDALHACLAEVAGHIGQLAGSVETAARSKP
jgi:pyroglutamyl-peptidase